MSIFAPSLPGGSAQGSLPPDGHPCKAQKSPLVTALPPPEVSGLGDAAAGAGSGRAGRPGSLRGQRGLWRGHGPDGPCRASAPGPSAARSAPLRRAAAPCPPGRPRPCAQSQRRASPSARAPRGPPHTPAGTRRRKNCGQRRTGAGEVAPSQGPRPEGRRGGAATAHRVRRVESFAPEAVQAPRPRRREETRMWGRPRGAPL